VFRIGLLPATSGVFEVVLLNDKRMSPRGDLPPRDSANRTTIFSTEHRISVAFILIWLALSPEKQ
jgi:hypothetical protein